jgi:hypothetical protein
MDVMCFGGPRDRQVIAIDGGLDYFHVAGDSQDGMSFTKHTYYVYRGTDGSRNWRFAVIGGTAPTDEMARDSEPNGEAKMAKAMDDASDAMSKRITRAIKHQRWSDRGLKAPQ